MLFTALYILLGVQVVFSYAGALYDEVFHTETGLIASCFWWVRNWCKRRQLRREIDEEDAADVAFEAGKSAKQVSAWAFFKQHLLPGMLAGDLVNIVVGAAVFKAIDIDDNEYAPIKSTYFFYNANRIVFQVPGCN